MIEIKIANKWFSLGGSSVVRDLEGRDLMKVKGKVFSMRSRKYLYDLNDKLRYEIRNRFWNFFRYECYIFNDKEEKVATVGSNLFQIRDRYEIDTGIGHITILGNILHYNYHILYNGREIGHVARKISLRDSFVLTIEESQDIFFFTALVVAIDNICDRKNNDNNGSMFSSD